MRRSGSACGSSGTSRKYVISLSAAAYGEKGTSMLEDPESIDTSCMSSEERQKHAVRLHLHRKMRDRLSIKTGGSAVGRGSTFESLDSPSPDRLGPMVTDSPIKPVASDSPCHFKSIALETPLIPGPSPTGIQFTTLPPAAIVIQPVNTNITTNQRDYPAIHSRNRVGGQSARSPSRKVKMSSIPKTSPLPSNAAATASMAYLSPTSIIASEDFQSVSTGDFNPPPFMPIYNVSDFAIASLSQSNIQLVPTSSRGLDESAAFINILEPSYQIQIHQWAGQNMEQSESSEMQWLNFTPEPSSLDISTQKLLNISSSSEINSTDFMLSISNGVLLHEQAAPQTQPQPIPPTQINKVNSSDIIGNFGLATPVLEFTENDESPFSPVNSNSVIEEDDNLEFDLWGLARS